MRLLDRRRLPVADAIWDITDPVIGRLRLQRHRSSRGQSYTATLDTNLPPATPGQYRVIVRTDIFDDVFESNELNNTTAFAPLSSA